VLLGLVLAAAVAVEAVKDTVTKVDTSSVQVQDTAHYAVKQLQSKLPRSSAETFHLETVLTALSQPSQAEVVKASMHNFLGMSIPMREMVSEKGTLYYVTLLTAHTSSSPLTRQLNPWPMWELMCAKVWTRGKDERSTIKLVTPHRKRGIFVHTATVQQAAEEAVAWLGRKVMRPTSLVTIVGAESQDLLVQHLHKLNTEHGKVNWGVESQVSAYFITLLIRTGGARSGTVTTHMFAVTATSSGTQVDAPKTGFKVAAHFGGEQPGLTIVSGSALLNTPLCPVDEGSTGQVAASRACSRKHVAAFRGGVAQVGGWDGVTGAETVQVSSWKKATDAQIKAGRERGGGFDDRSDALGSGGGGGGGGGGGLISLSRNMVVETSFSVGVTGDGASLVKVLKSPSAAKDIAREMSKLGVPMPDAGVQVFGMALQATDSCGVPAAAAAAGAAGAGNLRTVGQHVAAGRAVGAAGGSSGVHRGWGFAAAMASVVAACVILGGVWMAHIGRLRAPTNYFVGNTAPRSPQHTVSSSGGGDPATSYQQVQTTDGAAEQ